MAERAIEVSTYSGYRGDECPRAFILDEKRVEVRMVVAQWIEEDAATRVRRRCFRVKGDDLRTHTLRYLEDAGLWLHEEKANG